MVGLAHLVDIFFDVFEACLGNQSLDLGDDVHGPTNLFAGLGQAVLPSVVGTVDRKSVIIGRAPNLKVANLNPATGFQIVHTLAKECGPVGDGAAQVANMDPVKRLLKGPVSFGVVNQELQVWGNPGGLNGAEICGYDLCLWKLVGDVDGPDSGTGSEIENATGVLDWGFV